MQQKLGFLCLRLSVTHFLFQTSLLWILPVKVLSFSLLLPSHVTFTYNIFSRVQVYFHVQFTVYLFP